MNSRLRYGGLRRSAAACVFVLAALCAPLASESLAQGPPSGPPYSETEPIPQTHGQWSGPWDLERAMTLDETGAAYVPAVWEIAHSFLVPPRSPADVAASDFKGWVMFMNRRGSSMAGPSSLQPTYLWNPDAPNGIEPEHHVMIPGGLDVDVFCSGHNYMADGRPVTAGGQDTTQGGSTVGQAQSYVLGTNTPQHDAIPMWSALGAPALVDRWYPTLALLADGRLLQVGNSRLGEEFVQGVSCRPPLHDAHPDCADFYRSLFDPSVGQWGVEAINRREGTSPGDCAAATPVPVTHYPRLHLLGSGELMWVDGIASTPKVINPGGPDEHSVLNHAAYFLHVDPQTPADCTTTLDTPYQWREGTPTADDEHDASQKGAPTVHLLWPDDPGLGSYHEVVYQFGGTITPHDDNALCPPVPSAMFHPSSTDRVVRMVNPSETQPWDDDLVEDMSYGRVNHNAVILLDGSVLIVGGLEPGEAPCTARKVPELFRPQELFGGSPSEVWRWRDMDPQQSARSYHSVAGLLPDGRVFSAGGAWENETEDERHTVELFSPPYLFSPYRRPSVASPDSAVSYGETVDLQVSFPQESSSVARVALVRPGSTTHGFDMAQRYIVLPHLPPVQMSTDVWKVSATLPSSASVAPPGWYLITVIGGPQDVPSPGEWVLLG